MIRLYKELNEIDSEEALCSFEKRLMTDSAIFHNPQQALLDIVRIKVDCGKNRNRKKYY